MSIAPYRHITSYQDNEYQVGVLIAIKTMTDQLAESNNFPITASTSALEVVDDFIWSLYRIDLLEVDV